ncbi:uncharacterized protein LOC129588318 [Paramacrobiotus metropolitanus]|uniref:uncharacterized protein LOC129588318 n=1 Tax=Paramacrobiotus metropolitanus TaxID=2943436 RepID=UPI00244586EC|nr:uncharacterized protein LOC129588318 [Paramacrobiotus metropolitanus]
MRNLFFGAERLRIVIVLALISCPSWIGRCTSAVAIAKLNSTDPIPTTFTRETLFGSFLYSRVVIPDGQRYNISCPRADDPPLSAEAQLKQHYGVTMAQAKYKTSSPTNSTTSCRDFNALGDFKKACQQGEPSCVVTSKDPGNDTGCKHRPLTLAWSCIPESNFDSMRRRIMVIDIID